MTDTLIKVDLSKSPVENENIHNRWHPDIPMACWVKPGDDFILETFDWTGGFIKNNDSAVTFLCFAKEKGLGRRVEIRAQCNESATTNAKGIMNRRGLTPRPPRSCFLALRCTPSNGRPPKSDGHSSRRSTSREDAVQALSMQRRAKANPVVG